MLEEWEQQVLHTVTQIRDASSSGFVGRMAWLTSMVNFGFASRGDENRVRVGSVIKIPTNNFRS